MEHTKLVGVHLFIAISSIHLSTLSQGLRVGCTDRIASSVSLEIQDMLRISIGTRHPVIVESLAVDLK